VGLTGRLRPVTQVERRLEECAKLGSSAVLAPAGTSSARKITISEAETVRQAVAVGLETPAATSK
jgi:predicted ATP-dependent serine protease